METVLEESGYTDMQKADRTSGQTRLENLKELTQSMQQFETLQAYLEHVSLVMDLERATSDDPNGDGAVQIMTLHGAKGLEFPLVFVCGMEENLFPTARAVEESRINPQAIEEERRLCYVGMTRAREKLSLTYALRRYAYGSLIETEPSRFINELPTDLIETSYEIDRGFARSGQRVGPPPAKRKKNQHPRASTTNGTKVRRPPRPPQILATSSIRTIFWLSASGYGTSNGAAARSSSAKAMVRK